MPHLATSHSIWLLHAQLKPGLTTTGLVYLVASHLCGSFQLCPITPYLIYHFFFYVIGYFLPSLTTSHRTCPTPALPHTFPSHLITSNLIWLILAPCGYFLPYFLFANIHFYLFYFLSDNIPSHLAISSSLQLFFAPSGYF